MEEKIKKLLVEEFDNMKRIVPWDGMYDSLIKKLIKLVTDDVMKVDIDLEVSAEHQMMKDRNKIWPDKD